jgi:hypothetical protein
MIRTTRTKLRPFVLLFASLAILLGITAQAQVVSGTIAGTVTDPSGAVIANARVLVHHEDTGVQRSLITSSLGTFTAAAIPIGSYTVTVDAPSFASYKRTGITLTVGETLNLNLSVKVTGSDTITVQDVPSAVNTSSEQISGLVDARQVKELPLNGRSYDQLLLLNPVTVNCTNQRSGSTGTSNSSVGSMFSVSGRRPQDNLFLLNGIEYTGASLINTTPGGTSGQLLGIDGIHEFNVVSDTYSASYGKRDGAQISISTTGGTNTLHGSVYEFLRNSFFDARNYFDSPRIPEFQRNNFGASLGGPIKKDKLFLFVNYEGYRQNLGESAPRLSPACSPCSTYGQSRMGRRLSRPARTPESPSTLAPRPSIFARTSAPPASITPPAMQIPSTPSTQLMTRMPPAPPPIPTLTSMRICVNRSSAFRSSTSFRRAWST